MILFWFALILNRALCITDLKMNPSLSNPVQLISILIKSASLIYPETGIGRFKDKAKFVFRGLSTPRLTQAWLQIISSPELEPVVKNYPRLLSKLQRPYLHRDLSASNRLVILKEHFRFLTNKVSISTVKAIYSGNGLLLEQLQLADAGIFSLRLFYRDVFEKEGEMTVALCDESGASVIFAMSFTIAIFSPGVSTVFIGGLQSFKDNSRELVVSITRAMQGLRPKGLLLFVVQQLAKIWDMQKIRAVSNDMSVFQDFRLKKKKVFADYDAFWIESGGEMDADGLFTLPTKFVARPMTDIKPNKRTLYKKRYVMLEELAEKMTASLHRS